MISPTCQEVYAPNAATIICHFTRIRCPEPPQWSGPALSFEGRFMITTSSRMSVLTIHSIQEEDEGEYRCRCGQLTKTSTLVVRRKSL